MPQLPVLQSDALHISEVSESLLPSEDDTSIRTEGHVVMPIDTETEDDTLTHEAQVLDHVCKAQSHTRTPASQWEICHSYSLVAAVSIC